MGFLHHPLHPPIILLNSFYYVIGDGVLRFFLTRDRKFDALTFDTTTGGKFGADLLPQSIASDASDTDISAFERRGGKFLMRPAGRLRQKPHDCFSTGVTIRLVECGPSSVRSKRSRPLFG